jgi:hypothetical protein
MRRWIALFCLTGLAAGLAACNLPSASTPTVGGIDYIRTAAALTLDAISTTMVVPPGTPIPTRSGQTTSVPTQVQAATPIPGGATATATGTIVPCDQVSFLRDLTIPDGTLISPGTAYTKIWELKNTGSCAWNSLYTLVFANQGDLMGGAISQPLITSGAVQPGETVKVSVNLSAPVNQGDYKGHWRLRNPTGTEFGPAGKTFWVAIKVSTNITLLDNLCNAGWRNASGEVPCPGKSGDVKGAVYKVDNPKFASGYQDDEPAVAFEPQQINDGVVTGALPPYLLNSTQTLLRTFIGCAFGANACNVNVTITAQAGSEAEQKIGEWNVAYNKDWVPVKVDLATMGMAGKTVTLRITVTANGSANQDRVYFLNPGFFKP